MDVSFRNIEPLLEDIDFLCRTANRVVVLDALTDGALDRPGLQEKTGVSRPTLGRILDEFEERNWIVRDGRDYCATPVGEFIVQNLVVFLERMETARTLAPVMRWVPPDGFGFDIFSLHEAEIVYATANDPLAPLRRIDEWLQSGQRIRLVSYEITTSGLDAVARVTADGDRELVAIFTPGVYDTIAENREMCDAFRELLGTENAEFYVSAEERPLLLTIVDDTTCIGLTEDGMPRAVLVSEDENVCAWADETFTEYRNRASPIEQSTFTV